MLNKKYKVGSESFAKDNNWNKSYGNLFITNNFNYLSLSFEAIFHRELKILFENTFERD